MKNTIQDYFAIGYNSTKRVDVEMSDHIGTFSLFDKKACDDSQKKRDMDGNRVCLENCNQEVAIIESFETVHVVEHESFIGKFKLKAIADGGRCDKLLYTDKSLMFIELSCLNPEYLGNNGEENEVNVGKRAKAKKQLRDSISRMQRVEKIKSKIDTFASRYAIFAYREKENKTEIKKDKKVLDNMRSFIQFEDYFSTNRLETHFDNGFVFKAVKYPEVIVI